MITIVKSHCDHEYDLAHSWEACPDTQEAVEAWNKRHWRQLVTTVGHRAVHLHLMCDGCLEERERNASKQVYHAIMGFPEPNPTPQGYRDQVIADVVAAYAPHCWWMKHIG